MSQILQSNKQLRIGLYDFEGRNDLELSFCRGDIITVISQDSSGWWKGSFDSKTGTFPEPYTAPVKEAVILFNIPPIPEVPHALTIEKNQVVYLINKENPDWWRVFYQKKEGFVPSSFIKEKDETNWQAIAMYNFTTEITEGMPPLCFSKGEEITILKKDRNWWCGYITSKPEFVGQFPSNFVKLVHDANSFKSIQRVESLSSALHNPKNSQPPNTFATLPRPISHSLPTQKLQPSAPEEVKKEQIREKVIEEIVQTEVMYSNDLNVMNEVYVIPLSDKKSSKILPSKEVKILFGNFAELLQLSQKLIKKWEEQKIQQNLTHIEVGDALFEMAEDFKIYTEYCVNHPSALKLLEKCSKNEKYLQFEAIAMANPSTKGLNLTSYLIKPIQRICKYPILLRELIKNTPENHPEFNTLSSAMDKIEQVVSYINENKRFQENRSKLEEIENQFEGLPKFDFVKNTRELIQDIKTIVWAERENATAFGELTTVVSSEYKVWLFNDLLLLGKAKKDKYKYVNRITLDKVIIRNKDEKIGFEIRKDDDKKWKIDMFLKDKELNDKFINQIQQAKSQYSEKHKLLEEAEAQKYFQKFEFTEDNRKKKLLKFFGEDVHTEVNGPKKTKNSKSKAEAFFGDELSIKDFETNNVPPLLKYQSEVITKKNKKEDMNPPRNF